MSNDVIRVGDRFLVECEVWHLPYTDRTSACCMFKRVDHAGQSHIISRSVLLAGKRLPCPLKAGDRVRLSMGLSPRSGRIVVIHRGKAWVDWGDYDGLYPFADLTPAEESAS